MPDDLIEHLAYDARLTRLGELAALLTETLRRSDEPRPLVEFLTAAAREHRLPMSQAKYGLTYAKSIGVIVVDSVGLVRLA